MKRKSTSDKTNCSSVFMPFCSRKFPPFSILLAILLIVHTGLHAFGQNPTKTFAPGAYIIDMGQPTQTIANGLKPYGLVYRLIIDEGIPVNWAINSSKVKDGIDFSADGKNYRGGSFIIASECITESVVTLINTWKAKGVVVNGPIVGGFIAPVYRELTSWPTAVLDAQNDLLITPYYYNAEVPTSTYKIHANPTMLTGCNDMYILPHADPDLWDAIWIITLQNYINNGGYLWSGCHAVSVLENLPGCNFLSNNGLVPYHKVAGVVGHDDGTTPYTYLSSSDASPIMQFIGNMDGATKNGSEQIYVPKAAGWRSMTTLAAYDANYVTRPDTSVDYTYPKAASVIVFGSAFGDTSKGMVMYEAAHQLNVGNATIAQQVAAQRAYFNFVLMAGVQTRLTIDVTFPDSLKPDSTYLLIAKVNGGNSPYTYLWSSIGGGTFSRASTDSIYFTAPSTFSNIIIKFKVNDTCGRVNSAYKKWEKPLPVEFLNYDASYSNGITTISWSTASETNNDFFNVEKSLNLIDVSQIGTIAGAGNSNVVLNYFFKDNSPGVGEVYYRIRQTDFDGATDVSNWMVVDIPSNNPIGVFVDNTSDQIKIFFGNDVSLNYEIELFDLVGNNIASVKRPSGGSSEVIIDLNKQLQGIYFVNISSEKHKITRKIILD